MKQKHFKGEKIQFVTVFSRTELSKNPIKEYLPEKHHDIVEVWYAVLDEIDLNCVIEQHKKIKPETLKYIGD